MLVRAVRAVLDAGIVQRVRVDVDLPDRDVLRACAGLPVDVGTYPVQRGVPGDGSVTPVILVRHDARRPLTPTALVAAVVEAVRAGHSAAVPVLPLTDTVKEVGADGVVRGSPDRDGLLVVQAPRAWRAGHDSAATFAIPGDPRALAIRTEWDLEIAELMA
jgi:2-C-methyl-D-erythritol 4-phosphate cytidylyltransferase